MTLCLSPRIPSPTCPRGDYGLRRVNKPCARALPGVSPFASDAFPVCYRRARAMLWGRPCVCVRRA